MCDHGDNFMVPTRQLEFLMIPARTDKRRPPDILVRQRQATGPSGHADTIIARTDGLACTRCGTFIPGA